MPSVDAAERVRRRLNEWRVRTGHGAGTQLAHAVHGKYGARLSNQWASGIFGGRQDLRLKDLDAVAELLGVPPGDLVRRDDDHYLEVIPSEMLLLRHIRSLPDTVRHHLLKLWDYTFSFQAQVLKDQKVKVDQRTKAARLLRHRKEPSDTHPHHPKAG